MIAVALTTVIYWRSRAGVAPAFFLWGAGAWTVAVILKGIAAIPTPTIIAGARATLRYLADPALWLYEGLLTGIFECGVVLAFAYLIGGIRQANWQEAVGFGAGFGAVEAFFLGLSSFVLILLVILIPGKLPPKLLALVTSETGSPLVIPAPIVERITAILIHIFSSLLIIYALQTGKWRWFWASFFYKTLVDGIAGFVHITYGIENLTTLGLWLLELGLLPFGIVGAWGLWVFRRRWKPQAD